MMIKEPMIQKVADKKRQSIMLMPQNTMASNKRGTPSRSLAGHNETRPLSMYLMPGQQLQAKATANPTPANNSVLKDEVTVDHDAPHTMEEAFKQFEITKRMAKSKVKSNLSATQRLVNALADMTMILLTRAMNENMLKTVEIRIHKKPISLGNGMYAFAEYRDGSKKHKDPSTGKAIQQSNKNPNDSSTADDDFVMVAVGELLPGEGGKERDNIESWKKWFDVVQKWTLWWRFCMAIHKRIGWGCKIDRSALNVIDSRVLGYVTIKISNFI